ncbi:MAG: sulfatase [Methylococcus sp.]
MGLLTAMTPAMAASPKQPPNILLIITDDTGLDQFNAFGYGGTEDEKAKTPNIDALARAGVRFSNAWSHPSCGPTRASILSGRFTPRYNMLTAPAPPDLPNSQTSPYEYTIPKILRKRNYVSAVVGKMHQSTEMRDQANLPFLNETMRKLGFDYFEGYLEGGPSPIDTTAGGVGGSSGNGKTYGCGFVPSLADNPTDGSDSGACYTSDPNPGCSLISTATEPSPGRACLEKGGIFVPGVSSCSSPRPANLNFSVQNGHYTGNWVINKEDGVTTETQPVPDSRGRGFKTQQEVSRAVAWINQHKAGSRPWMMSLGLSAIHEPVQQSPKSLVSSNSANTGGFQCNNNAQNRELATQMVEAIDHEVGRLLVETGLASYGAGGELVYKPNETNTWVIFTSDNGTWTSSVRSPFDSTRAKGTPYQTGVSVPLIIAGPTVKSPDREVDHMVNLADLYAFFGEAAGLNVRKEVPRYRDLDAQKMMGYLRNPRHGAIRKTNYTVQGNNLRASSKVSYPCLLKSMNQCTYSLPAASVCADQGGVWYGPGSTEPGTPFTSCCQVNKATGVDYASPLTATGIRDKNFKLVRQTIEKCVDGAAQQPPKVIEELYQINQTSPEQLKLDKTEFELMKGDPGNLNGVQRRHYKSLVKRLKRLEAGFVSCPGDGNMDKVVNRKDLEEWARYTSGASPTTENGGGKGSWYDFGGPSDSTRPDGITDDVDRQIIEANMGKRCK